MDFSTEVSGNKFLVVVDMQNDFIDGSLGTPEAVAVVPRVVDRIGSFEGTVVCTLDTHGEDYPDTREGRMLPIPHCIRGTHGWSMPDPVEAALAARGARRYEKPTFGSVELAEFLRDSGAVSVGVIGLCTDICVVSNALMIRTFLPEADVWVDASCCAGSTPEMHSSALETMGSCQVRIVGNERCLFERPIFFIG